MYIIFSKHKLMMIQIYLYQASKGRFKNKQEGKPYLMI